MGGPERDLDEPIAGATATDPAPCLVPAEATWCYHDPSRALAPLSGPLRVATCNLAHGRGNAVHQVFQSPRLVRRNLDRVVRALAHCDVHVVALQEADARNWWSGGFDHVRYLAKRWGAAHAVLGSHVARFGLDYGTGLISRLPIHDARSGRFVGPRYRPGKGVCSVEVEAWPERSLSVHAVHLDFLSPLHRRRQLEQISAFLTGRDVVCGDFNAAWRDRDGALPEFCARHALQAWRPNERGLITFPSRQRRIDWIFATDGLEVCGHRVDRHRISDHRMVVMELRPR